ncbi:MAG: polysaccharide biosynthesis tyrosine autokinase [Verrucomicrobiae bacterium]|nr:polysaccharide biosynthesis tyrosine autokinase [Verrucomicrobiae bacterium]NNJ44028.1 polysaccharide biosynthesis tyrosine autokinase [Akkermansiaceae bacterium]
MTDFPDDLDNFDNETERSPKQGLSRLRMAFVRWWLILIFAILGYVIALYTLSIAEPSHKARAVLELITKQRSLVGAELESDRLAMDSLMVTIANKLVGPSQLTKVVNSAKIQAIEKAVPPTFSLKPKYWRNEKELVYKSAADVETSEVVKMITGNLKVVPRNGTTLIDIIVTHKDSVTAMTIADAIMEQYLATEEERKSGGATEAFKILRAEANAAAQELETARRSIESYKSVLASNELLKAKRDELVLLKLRYKSKHPKMIEARAILNDLKQRFRREITAVSQLPSELEFWAQHREQVDFYNQAVEKSGVADPMVSPVDETESEASWLVVLQAALASREASLQSSIQSKQSLYDTVTKRITEIDVAEENDNRKIKIAERAYPSGNIEVDKYKRLSQGLVGGMLFGFAIAYLMGMIDYKIYDVRTVETAIGLNCLSAIPDGSIFDIDHDWVNVLTAEPNTPSAEAIRNLRASVTLLGKAERHQTILITSSVPGEGKTTVATELAAAFALNEQKTLLIDFDLRKPRVHKLFPQLEREPGMSDVLSGQIDLEKVVQKTGVEGLHLITAGTKAPNPSELFQENELREIISKLSKYYDRVIIDSAPVLPVSDTRLLVNHVHSVVLVVRALKAPAGAILRAKELLMVAKAPLVGAVLNAMKTKHTGGGYYGYRDYGEYGGSYGYYGDDE